MKKFVLSIFLLVSLQLVAFSQYETTLPDTGKVIIIKTDKTEMVGTVISQDAREILFLTEDGRQIYIPQHTILKIEKITKADISATGEYIGEDRFATRYTISTNGLPIRRGEHYINWTLVGPDIQLCYRDNLGIGVMTSWFGTPVIGTVKYSHQLSEKNHIAVGALLGTGSWAMPEFAGMLPYVAFSQGTRTRNFAVSIGYVGIRDGQDTYSAGLIGLGGMAKMNAKLSLVFDSMVVMNGEDDPFALIMPGLRWHTNKNSSFQITFGGVVVGDDTIPFPMLNWFNIL
jgi:hypothetical protein